MLGSEAEDILTQACVYEVIFVLFPMINLICEIEIHEFFDLYIYRNTIYYKITFLIIRRERAKFDACI